MSILQADQVLLFEDHLARTKRFLPLTYTRPVALLRSGMYTMLERLQLLAKNCSLHTSQTLKAVTEEATGLSANATISGEILFLNSRALLDEKLIGLLATLPIDTVLSHNNEIVAARLQRLSDALQQKITNGEPIERNDLPDSISYQEAEATLFGSIWSMVHHNGKTIASDVTLAAQQNVLPPALQIAQNIFVEGAENVFVHSSAQIGAGTVLDAHDGPIVIEEGVRIYPNSTIMGPAVIGKNSLIKIGAKIYEGTSIGPTCKIGGEVENSIVLGFSNKQHDGYLGHSYLGEWVNLGADTNTSDLKNDYSNVRVTIEGEEFNTNSLFVGLMMGDHSKSAINTQFNTGTVVGVSCNVFDSGFPPKWIPNFSWGGAKGFEPYKIEKALRVAEIVVNRRKHELTPAQRELLTSLAK